MISTGFITIVSREVRRFLSLYNQTLIPGVLTTLLYLIVFGKSLGSRIGEIDGISYMDYIIPGLAMMNVITNAYSNSASSLFQAKLLNFLGDILITPLSGLEISLGYIIGGALRGLLNGILVLMIGILLTGMPVLHPFLTLVFLVVVGWAFGAAGVLVGIFAKSFENIQVLVNFFFTPLVFLGGVFYSIEMLPPFWRNLSQLNPLYYMINGLRFSVLEAADSSLWLSLTVSVVAAIVFTLISTLLFSAGYRIKD